MMSVVALTLAVIAAPFEGWQLQAPKLGAPERGSLVGPLAQVGLTANDLARGGFRLGPFVELPTERGAPLFDVLPSYSPDNPQTEWGLGWSSTLSIRRARVSGHVDYLTDDRSGPWGHMIRGTDGAWYPVGLGSPVRVVEDGAVLTAFLPDGRRAYFGGAARERAVREGREVTYAWYLYEVEDVDQHRTRLDWSIDPGIRPRLTAVHYGGGRAPSTERMRIEYETIDASRRLVDRRSGQPIALAHRVSRVLVESIDRRTGQWVLRWFHVLGYDQSAGPAFYLTSVVRVFSDRGVAPTLRFAYERAEDRWASGRLAPVHALDPLLDTVGAGIIQPQQSTLFDLEDDSRPDLELARDGSTFVRTDAGYERRSLPIPSVTEGVCRSPPNTSNPPRHLAKIRARDDEPSVVVVTPGGPRTRLTICDRAGQRRPGGRLDLRGDWSLGRNGRLSDVDGDHRPDLVRVSAGRVDVLFNRSHEMGFVFTATTSSRLEPSIAPEASWVLDFTGDAIADLVVQQGLGLRVWAGAGHGRFEHESVYLPFRDGDRPLSVLVDGISFLDANKDGLADVLLTTGQTVLLLVDDGRSLSRARVDALLQRDVALPVVADFAATGEEQVTLLRRSSGRIRAFGLAVTTPGTSLLVDADDGQGTRLHFEYGRGPAIPGSERRPSILSRFVMQRGGEAPVVHELRYGRPRFHTVGRFFLGFSRAEEHGPMSIETTHFVDDDRYAHLALSTRVHDRLQPEADDWTSTEYQEARFRGVDFLRILRQRQGRGARGRGPESTRQHLSYDGPCSVRTVARASGGTLTTTQRLARPQRLDGHISCLPEHIVLAGRHPDASLDFNHRARLDRDARGALTEVTSIGAGALVLQRVGYRADGAVAWIEKAGEGRTDYEFDPSGRELLEIRASDGRITRVIEQEPSSGKPQRIDVVLGPGRTWRRDFVYDARDRLIRSWDNVGTSSVTSSERTYAYREGSFEAPAAVTETVQLDAQAIRTTMLLATAAGDTITTLSLIPQGWAASDIAQRLDASGERRTLPSRALPDDARPTFAQLFDGAWIARSMGGPAGATVAVTRHREGVEGTVTTSVSASGGRLHHRMRDDAGRTSVEHRDVAGNVVERVLPSGRRYRYRYDALGRLRRVELPDGTSTVRDYDGHGRVSQVRRSDGLGVALTYAPRTGLLARKQLLGRDGRAHREVRFEHDRSGRVLVETHVDLDRDAQHSFRRYYDGARPGRTTAPDHGTLTGVSGPGFTKRFWHEVDGNLSTEELELDGHATLRVRYHRSQDGAVIGEDVEAFSADGRPISEHRLRTELDRLGRPAAIAIDDRRVAALTYDVEGRPARLELSDGGGVHVGRDPLTKHPSHQRVLGSGWSITDQWQVDRRGLIDAQTITTTTTTVLHYTYDPDGLIASMGMENYRFDAVGRLVARGDEHWSWAGDGVRGTNVSYDVDVLGRVTSTADATLVYGPDGHVRRARAGHRELDYLYDEGGRRIAKLADGEWVAGWLGSRSFTHRGLFLPIDFAGRTVGSWGTGRIVLAPIDGRGSIWPWRSPFGAGPTSNPLRENLDYLGAGHDDELGAIRFGVRDYDPRIGAFRSPDPLLLEDLDELARRPLEANLWSFASGNPVSRRDVGGLADSITYTPELTLDPSFWSTTINRAHQEGAAFDPSPPPFRARWGASKSEQESVRLLNKVFAVQKFAFALVTALSMAVGAEEAAIVRVAPEVDLAAAATARAEAALGQELAMIRRQPGLYGGQDYPSVIIGASHMDTGVTVVGRASATVHAEVDAAMLLGGDASRIRFSQPVRPRLMFRDAHGNIPTQSPVMPVCKECAKLFTPNQFPSGK